MIAMRIFIKRRHTNANIMTGIRVKDPTHKRHWEWSIGFVGLWSLSSFLFQFFYLLWGLGSTMGKTSRKESLDSHINKAVFLLKYLLYVLCFNSYSCVLTGKKLSLRFSNGFYGFLFGACLHIRQHEEEISLVYHKVTEFFESNARCTSL